MIVASFVKVVYPLKHPSNACLSWVLTMTLVVRIQFIKSTKLMSFRGFTE